MTSSPFLQDGYGGALLEHESTCAVRARQPCDCDLPDRLTEMADLLARAWDHGWNVGYDCATLEEKSSRSAAAPYQIGTNPFRAVVKPKWTDLIGIDPDYTEGVPVEEWLEANRGEA